MVNLKDIAAPAGDRIGVIWTLDTSSDPDVNLVRVGAGQGLYQKAPASSPGASSTPTIRLI